MNKIFNFGYTKVTSKEKTKLVQKVFSDVSKNYDLMNDIMSLGAHRLWKKNFIQVMNPSKNKNLIDVACGTGDIANLYIKYTNQNSKILCIDPNIKMINKGKKNGNRKQQQTEYY